MKTVEKLRLTDERKIEELQRSGVLQESLNPSNPSQRGFRFSRACFLRHPQNGNYVRIVGFVESDSSKTFDIILVNCGNGTRERLSASEEQIGRHIYSALSTEGKYDNRPRSEELYIVASTKKEAKAIIKDLSISGFWSLDRSISILPSSLSRVI